MQDFKYLWTTDTHFGLETDGVENPLTGLNTRAEDAFQAFDQLIDYAIEKNIKLVIHSGDAMNSKTVNQSVVNAFYERIKRLSDAGITFYLLQGNHDASQNLTKKNGLDIASVLQLPNVYVTRGGDIFDLGYLQIASVSYWNTADEIIAEIDKQAAKIDWNRPAILVSHLQVQYEGFSGSFRANLEFVPVSGLIIHPWQFVHLGHIHKPELLNEDPPVAYGGSLVRCTFTEEKDPKGFWEVSFKNGKYKDRKHVPVTCLKMLTVKGTMSDIKASLENVRVEKFEDTIVRCIIDESEDPIDYKFLKQKFSKAFRHRITKISKRRELVKMEITGLKSMEEYANRYFEKSPNKSELLELIKDISSLEEGKV